MFATLILAAMPLLYAAEPIPMPSLASTQWLADNLNNTDIVVIDFRPQPEYNSGHIPKAFNLQYESLRTNLRGLPSMLLPAGMIARHLSYMGVRPESLLVLVYGDKPQDATLPAVALDRVGHQKYVVLDGGHRKWAAENRAVESGLPRSKQSTYRAKEDADHFTITAQQVLEHVNKKDAVIIDVRPPEYFSGQKSEEARAGHIPGAINRPLSQDIVQTDGIVTFKPIADLAAAYAGIIPDKNSTVIVHCRTGREASQTFFVLRHLLGYANVLYYDAGWTEWATRLDLPVQK